MRLFSLMLCVTEEAPHPLPDLPQIAVTTIFMGAPKRFACCFDCATRLNSLRIAPGEFCHLLLKKNSKRRISVTQKFYIPKWDIDGVIKLTALNFDAVFDNVGIPSVRLADASRKCAHEQLFRRLTLVHVSKSYCGHFPAKKN